MSCIFSAEKFKLCSGSVGALSPELFTRLLKSASTLGDTRNCPVSLAAQFILCRMFKLTKKYIGNSLRLKHIV